MIFQKAMSSNWNKSRFEKGKYHERSSRCVLSINTLYYCVNCVELLYSGVVYICANASTYPKHQYLLRFRFGVCAGGWHSAHGSWQLLHHHDTSCSRRPRRHGSASCTLAVVWHMKIILHQHGGIHECSFLSTASWNDTCHTPTKETTCKGKEQDCKYAPLQWTPLIGWNGNHATSGGFEWCSCCCFFIVRVAVVVIIRGFIAVFIAISIPIIFQPSGSWEYSNCFWSIINRT